MPIYMQLDGIVFFGASVFGYPLMTVSEGVEAVPESIGQFKPISVTFAYTSAMPLLMKEVANPRPILGGVFQFTKLNDVGEETAYMRMSLQNVTISKLEFNCGATGEPFAAMDIVWQTMQAVTLGAGGIAESFVY